jgi:hypothetical protein
MKQSLDIKYSTPTLALVILTAITLSATGCKEKQSEWKSVPLSSSDRNGSNADLKVKVLDDSSADVFRNQAVQDMKAHLEFPADAKFDPGFLAQSAVVLYETGERAQGQCQMLIKGRVSIQDDQGVRRIHAYSVNYLVRVDDEDKPMRKIAVQLDHKTIWSDPKYWSK